MKIKFSWNIWMVKCHFRFFHWFWWLNFHLKRNSFCQCFSLSFPFCAYFWLQYFPFRLSFGRFTLVLWLVKFFSLRKKEEEFEWNGEKSRRKNEPTKLQKQNKIAVIINRQTVSVECHMVEIALKWKWMLPSRRYVAETMDMRRNLSAAHKKMWRRARQPGRWRCLRRQQQRKGRCGEDEKIVTNGTNVKNKWRKHVLRSDNECNWCAWKLSRFGFFLSLTQIHTHWVTDRGRNLKMMTTAFLFPMD